MYEQISPQNAQSQHPTSAVVEANAKKFVYLQNGNAFQTTEVILGQTSGDMVEVKSGLFEGDMIVTQRAPQLYAQSLRGGSTASGDKNEAHINTEVTQAKTNLPIPLWLLGTGGVTLFGVAAFAAGSLWSSRRIRQRFVSVDHLEYDGFTYETKTHIDNHKKPTTSNSAAVFDQPDNNI
ncbi:MAG: hypothetical protein KME55_34695 [Nostoc indistinguendum CM1-VF10]|jgi:cobalt-zinc-cadmium efflux system membrane fusion protein|nr:hypothetical protein [Nostoc indistinguendum CM1-VF10]